MVLLFISWILGRGERIGGECYSLGGLGGHFSVVEINVCMCRERWKRDGGGWGLGVGGEVRG